MTHQPDPLAVEAMDELTDKYADNLRTIDKAIQQARKEERLTVLREARDWTAAGYNGVSVDAATIAYEHFTALIWDVENG